jgi:hypothetical protein
MKKQLLIAAVAASMTSVAMADISITGGAKFNYTNTDSAAYTSAAVAASSDYAAASTDPAYVAAGIVASTGLWVAQTGTAQIGTAGTAAAAVASNSTNTINHDVDFTIAGSAGDTGVSATFATTTMGTLVTENVFLTTKIGDFNVKTGSYAGGDSNLGNGTRADGKVSIDTTLAGIKLQFEDSDAATNGASFTISGEVSGVAISHEVFDTSTDSSISGSIGGVSIKYRSVDSDLVNSDKTSLKISGEMSGVTATFVDVDVDGIGTTTSDDFFGTHASSDINEATGFSLKTALAGNTITLKSYDIKKTSTAQDDSYTKIVVTRPLAGATFEATYTDADMSSVNDADSKSLDLELAVKF